jgi:thioredoxin 1
MNKSIATVTDNTFDQDVTQSPRPVLVYFWAEWCEECRPMSDTIQAVASEMNQRVTFLALDVDTNPRQSMLHAIASVPTVIVFISGKEQQRIEGLTNKAHLSSTIEMHISRKTEDNIQDQTSSVN